MDTTTKMMYIAMTEKGFDKCMLVMSEILNGKANKKTIETACEIEFAFPLYWQENQWLRMVAGSTKMDKKWVKYLQNEIKEEFAEGDDNNEDE